MEEIVRIFGIDGRLLFVQIINFGLLLLVLWYFLYRPVVKIIGVRQEKIAQGVHAAERAEEQLQEMEGKRKEVLVKASKEAELTLQNAISRADIREREIFEKAQARSEALLSDAKAKAEELKRKTLEESREEIARMIVLGAEKILREKT